MICRPRILLVAPTPSLAATLVTWLNDSGADVTVASTFATAKEQLQCDPDLVISEVRLGEYNGLHLALRAQLRRIPAMVIGGPNDTSAQDAQEMRTTYLRSTCDRREFLDTVSATVDRSGTFGAGEVTFVSPRQHRDLPAMRLTELGTLAS